jgi:hypothetical protein
MIVEEICKKYNIHNPTRSYNESKTYGGIATTSLEYLPQLMKDKLFELDAEAKKRQEKLRKLRTRTGL